MNSRLASLASRLSAWLRGGSLSPRKSQHFNRFSTAVGRCQPVSPGKHPERQNYLQEAALLGVPEAAMASTLPVVNAAEQARAVRRLLPAGQSRVQLVTNAAGPSDCLSARYCRCCRSPWTFRLEGAGPAPSSAIPPNCCPTQMPLKTACSLALREMLGSLVYRAW